MLTACKLKSGHLSDMESEESCDLTQTALVIERSELVLVANASTASKTQCT